MGRSRDMEEVDKMRERICLEELKGMDRVGRVDRDRGRMRIGKEEGEDSKLAVLGVEMKSKVIALIAVSIALYSHF